MGNARWAGGEGTRIVLDPAEMRHAMLSVVVRDIDGGVDNDVVDQ